jgi:beta-carotene 15,15'-dioxygenase
MKNINLNKYHTLTIFFLSAMFYLANFNLGYELTPLICFFLIATIGVSHGALDNLKGIKLLRKFRIKNNSYFYIAYIVIAFFVVLLWSILPLFTLLFFLLVASFHFGKEDNVFAKKKNSNFLDFFLFLKGSLVILAPLYFNIDETKKIFEILNVNIGSTNENIILIAIMLSLLSNFLISKNILLSFLDSISIILLNYTFDPLIAFTIYFCFLHSVRHSLSLIYEINKKNFNKGLFGFLRLALPLTVITCIVFLVGVYFLNHYYLLNSAILKVIFIGLASLTFPHILLEYLIEKNEKKS